VKHESLGREKRKEEKPIWIPDKTRWRRHFLPRLSPVGLGWANFQVMRRTHSSLMDDLGVDPQVRAEQMGHTVDVNENVYTQASFGRRRQAVNDLEKRIDVM
jgi:hypothetical protein